MTGARLPKHGTFVDDGTVTVNPMDIKGGAYFQVSNTSFDLPDPYRFDGATLVFNNTTYDSGDVCTISLPATTLSSPAYIYFDNEYSLGSGSIILNKKGIWTFKSLNGRLYLVDHPRHSQGTSFEYTKDGVTETLTHVDVDGGVFRTHNSTITLPSANYAGNEVMFHCYSTASGSTVINSIDGVGKMVDKTGANVDSITLASVGRNVRLVSINTRWTVVWQNF